MAAPENPFAVSVQNPELTYSRGMYNKPQDYVNKARLAAFGAKGELSPDLEDLTAESFEYSPEAQAYLNKVDEYLSKTQGGPYEVSPYGFSVTDRQTGAARPLTNEELLALAAKPDFENQFAASFANPTGEEAWDIGRFAVRPDQDVRLINRDTGEVVASGKGYEGGSLAAKAAAGMFGQEGKKANFILQGASPGGDWQTITEHKPEKSGFGTFLDISLPMIAGAAVGPLGLAKALGSSALAAGVAAGGGTALSGALQGRSFEDIVKSAAISGLTAGALDASGVSKFLAPTSGASAGATAPVTNAVTSAIPAAGDIVVTGIRNLAAPVISSALSTIPSIANSAAKYSNRNLINDQAAGIEQLPEITATAQNFRVPFTPPTTNLFGNAQYSGGENVRDTQPADEQEKFRDGEEIIVTAQQPSLPVPGVNPFSVPKVSTNFTEPSNSGLTQDEIEVTAKKTPEIPVPYVDPLTPRMDVTETLSDVDKGPDTNKNSTLDEVSKYMKLLGLGVGLAGNLFGGGGSGKSPGKYSSTGRLSSVFTDKLPTPGQNGAFTVGGLGGTAADRTLAARPVTDWYRYGMGSAMDIPAGADLSRATSPYAGYGPGTLGEETFRAVSGIPEKPVGMAHGGDMGYSRGSSRESFAVEGPGTGRSDDIPAVLSDGEYVIDAETVALLGDGSSKAGAKKLDQMRVSIRKHKGKNLAKGKFSVNAKRPEAYMSGGRI